MKSLFLVFFCVATALSVAVFASDDADKVVDNLLDKLKRGQGLNNYSLTEGVFKIGGQQYTGIKTGRIILQGIDNLKRTFTGEISSFSRSLYGTRRIKTVDLAVKGGLNLTSSLQIYLPRTVYSAQMKGTWKNPNQEAIFRFKELFFTPPNPLMPRRPHTFELYESTNNILNDMFEITLTCNNSNDQEYCNQLKARYLNSMNFDLHRYFQDILRTEINQITFDG